MQRTALFLDFDNTITQGDVLDGIVERFSAGDDWRLWESEWQQGRLSTAECLERQVAGLRATEDELREHAQNVALDPGFARIVRWAATSRVPLRILSDNFRPIIEAVLAHHGHRGLSVVANELRFDGDRMVARFPHRDPACGRCAHCKAQHLRAAAGRRTIYVGDGLSDLCPARIANAVFAKDSLADALTHEAIGFHRYGSLDDVLAALPLLARGALAA